MLTLLHHATALRDVARVFVYDLESSLAYGACDETPAHKVWHTLRHEGDGWPIADYATDALEDILLSRWHLPPTWHASVLARYEAGPPQVYTPTAWAAWLGIPEALYRPLVDLVLDGHIAHVWALADGATADLRPEAQADAQRVQRVLDEARCLPPASQLYLIHRLTDSLQYHLGAVSEEDALARGAPPRMPGRGTHGDDD
jgi:hypothetical protein